MDKEKFLPCFYDQELREKLWGLFNSVGDDAQKFAEVSNNWVEIKCVMAGCNEKWNLVKYNNNIYVEIQIVVDKNNMGVLFHEVFHSAFHKSPLWHSDDLHQNRYNGRGMWGEAFCDAFRYFMEEKLLDKDNQDKKSQFFENLTDCLTMSPEEIQDRFPAHNDSDHPGCHNLKFKIPTSIIIKKVNRDYGKFKNLWKELNEEYDRQSCDFLADYFNFRMKEEQKRLNCRR